MTGSDGTPALPGLEPPARPPSELEAAVRRTIADLATRGSLGEAQAARTALAVSLAQIIDDKRDRGRTSTVANDARVLVELLDKLVPTAPVEGGEDAELRQALEDFANSVDDDLDRSVGR